jgi:hypothetical protein
LQDVSQCDQASSVAPCFDQMPKPREDFLIILDHSG